MMTKTPPVYAYIRWSTDEQAKGDSERRQLDLAREYATKHNLELRDEYVIKDEGISAFDGSNVARGQLGRLLEKVRAGKVPRGSSLIVENLDRLSRQGIRESSKILNTFMDAGIEVHSFSDGRIYNAEKFDLTDYILSGVNHARATEESKRKSERVGAAWANKRAQASAKPLTKKAPAWLRLSANGKFEVLEDRAKVVRQIFEQSAAGIGTYTITRDLNERRVPPFGSSREWHESYVKKILSNRAVIGEFQPHHLPDGKKGKRVPVGNPVPNYYMRIIDDDLFFRARQGRAQRLIRDKGVGAGGRKGSNISNLFQKVAVCVYCGSKIRYINKGSGNTYLVCDKALRGLGCEKARWRYDDFEASFLEFVEELDLGSIVNSESEEQTRLKLVHDIESHRGKITSLEEEMDETLQLRTNNATARERVQKKLDELGQQIDAEKVTLKQKEHELQSRKFQPIDMDELRRTIARLQNGNGDRDVYKLRAQIASRLKALVSTIFVAVEGSVPLIDKVKDYEVEEGEVDITKLAPTDPRVTGRWFGAKFRDQGKVLIIAPNPDNPRELTRGSVVAPVLIPDVQE